MLYNKFVILISFFTFIFAQSSPQKPTDSPKDQAIQLKMHDGSKYCYSPYILKGEGYVYISNCSYATPARYDVFQRVAWNVNSKWLCMTAPSSVTGIFGASTEEWDYLRLRPCTINNPNQRWIIKGDAFYTQDGRFRVKDYNWWGYISKKTDAYYDHTIDKSMQAWINTIATPPTLTIQTFIGWTFVSTTKFAVYYLQNNQSYADEIKELYYNPENGHIAQYYRDTGAMYCLTAYHGKKQDWNWAGWENCSDKVLTKDNKYWEFALLNDNEGALRDKDGNFLRIAQYGPNWGVPYTVKPDYLKKDTTNTPKSIFLFDPYIDKWNRYVDSNLGDSLQYCPAPGNKTQSSIKSNNKRTIRSLPPTFRITEEWIRRFWQIASSTDGSPIAIGFCGTCSLQTYQIIAELQHYYLRAPLSDGGYFFNTAPNVDPFISFRQRFPTLAERLEGTFAFDNLPLRAGEDDATRDRRILYALSTIMLSDYTLYPSDAASTDLEVRNILAALFRAQQGTLWLFGVFRRDSSGNIVGHSQPILRVREGLMFIPTNQVNITFDNYQNLLTQSTASNVNEAINVLTLNRQRTIVSFSTIQVAGPYEAPANFYLSNNDCSGVGEGRRGNSRLPRINTVNQCWQGRCALQ